jgi:4-hydroxy-4-methyl-2-oxoglutarate aldolase
MTQVSTQQQQIEIATAQISDACIREKIAFFMAPAGLTSVLQSESIQNAITGRVIPVRHYGSVDVFLELIETTQNVEGAIMVIDNGGRTDEACIGDLIALEAKHAGFGAILIWGFHRDTRDLKQIGLPVFSYGAYPSGPVRLDAREPEAFESARFGDTILSADYTAFVDLDGAVFVETKHLEQIMPIARAIREREVKQAVAASTGTTLRRQFQFAQYLDQKQSDTNYTFRQHLRGVMSSIEE